MLSRVVTCDTEAISIVAEKLPWKTLSIVLFEDVHQLAITT